VTLLLVPTAGAAPVSVRVVGDAVGVEAAVDVPSVAGPATCQNNSAAGALDIAVAGDWDHQPFSSTILGETHTYVPAREYWNLWVNGVYSLVGLCDYKVNAGDRLLVLVQRDSAAFAPTVFPLELSGVPQSVGTGVPFTVTVTEQRAVPDATTTTTTPTPIAGATVSGGGASAQTDGAGHATITLSTAGNVVLRAARPGNVASDAVPLTAVAPAGSLATPPPPPVFTRDRSAPAANIRAIAEGRRFGRGFGPRELHVRVDPDPSGLLTVKLRLTRIDRGRCSYFSGRSERFVVTGRGDCSARKGFWFAVGDREQTNYLLPGRLPRGRYVLDANAIDKAYNRDDRRRRGGNRIVFHVG
jgi:hypothetical protein